LFGGYKARDGGFAGGRQGEGVGVVVNIDKTGFKRSFLLLA